ncbi:uncharacterized protein LOC133030987 [Cannabis sativa]|uniref:uncharacterized protein LOC133030987 n=1 Tax=Cannabis sativa TaxID=3483 RepID=UPI0029CA0B9F|nr:uncharacterized protein LOC133030987 [Cannabis sativa]
MATSNPFILLSLVLALFIFMEITLTTATNLKGLKNFTPNIDPKDPRGVPSTSFVPNGNPTSYVPNGNPSSSVPNGNPTSSVQSSIAKHFTTNRPNTPGAVPSSVAKHFTPNNNEDSRDPTYNDPSRVGSPRLPNIPGSISRSVDIRLTPKDRRSNDPPSFPDLTWPDVARSFNRESPKNGGSPKLPPSSVAKHFTPNSNEDPRDPTYNDPSKGGSPRLPNVPGSVSRSVDIRLTPKDRRSNDPPSFPDLTWPDVARSFNRESPKNGGSPKLPKTPGSVSQYFTLYKPNTPGSVPSSVAKHFTPNSNEDPRDPTYNDPSRSGGSPKLPNIPSSVSRSVDIRLTPKDRRSNDPPSFPDLTWPDVARSFNRESPKNGGSPKLPKTPGSVSQYFTLYKPNTPGFVPSSVAKHFTPNSNEDPRDPTYNDPSRSGGSPKLQNSTPSSVPRSVNIILAPKDPWSNDPPSFPDLTWPDVARAFNRESSNTVPSTKP